MTDDEAFNAWFQEQFHLPYIEGDVEAGRYKSAFVAGQLHELRRIREQRASEAADVLPPVDWADA